MPMDLTPQPDGRLNFSLGPVERWVVAGAATLLTILVGVVYAGITGKIGDQSTVQAETNKTLQQVVQQQAVTNAQMSTLSAQLADVPQLSRQMAETRVQVERNTQDISDLRRVRGAQ